MEYYQDGYRYGDPSVRPAAPGREGDQGPLPEEVDVLIVGSGPAGLVLAAQLAEFPDLSTRVVEHRGGPLLRGQADGLACRTVEILNTFGAAAPLMQEAYWVNEVTFWFPGEEDRSTIVRNGRVQEFPHENLSEFPHLIVNQARMQELLLARMRGSASRLEVDYGLTVTEVNVPEDPQARVLVHLEETDQNGQGTGVFRTVRARYVVGCDGAKSVVRKSIGRRLDGDVQNHAWGVMDILPKSDFPDIRKRAVIGTEHGSVITIPREGGHLVRFYVDLGAIEPGDVTVRERTTQADILAAAQRIMHPYTLEVRDTAWWSVYEVGQRLASGFDDVLEGSGNARDPRVFIAGDACHTHSAKAGQGMNVSMSDAFNLGWKLAAVLEGRSPASLLATYSAERQPVAQHLIDVDTKWSKMVGSKIADPEAPEEDSVAGSEVEGQFEDMGRFTAGLATRYKQSALTGASAHQDLAAGYPLGERFFSAPVIRLSDGKPMQLGHTHLADGKWRIFLFADAAHPASESSAFSDLCNFLLDSPDSPVNKFTSAGLDLDAVFDIRAVLQQDQHSVELSDLPRILFPAVGKFGLTDYSKVFAADTAGTDIFDARDIDRAVGAIVIVRPDQYVAQVLPLDAYEELQSYFAGFMLTK